MKLQTIKLQHLLGVQNECQMKSRNILNDIRENRR